MNNNANEYFLILLLFRKKYEFINKGTNVSFNQLLSYINKFAFSDENTFVSRSELVEFLNSKSNKKIIEYLFVDVITKTK